MCGIVALLGDHPDIHILDGLKRLENRGYDSMGISLITTDGWFIRKSASDNPHMSLSGHKYPESNNGIGHTRWATHGEKNELNAHPHTSMDGKITLVHNGIIENCDDIREVLSEYDIKFKTNTDTEVIANLIAHKYKSHSMSYVLSILSSIMKGTWSLCIQCIDFPNRLYCVRHKCALLVAYNDTSAMVASEQSGISTTYTSYFDVEDTCEISLENNSIHVSAPHTLLPLDTQYIESLQMETWTLQEINEQSKVIRNMINKYIVNHKIELPIEKRKWEHVILLGCGTSYFASCVARKFFTGFDTVQVFDGAEFNPSTDIPGKGECLFIFVSQSGETKDLQRCVSLIGNHTKIGIINVPNSFIAKQMDHVCYLGAGREVGVASTKSFTSQVVMLSLLSMYIFNIVISDIYMLPDQIERTLQTYIVGDDIIQDNCFVLGIRDNAYIAKEASLKIKELSCIHAEGYSSSSLKHGPFALLDEKFPVILIQPSDEFFDKNQNVYEEITARKAPVITIATTNLGRDNTIIVETNDTYQCILNMIPLQLLSYKLCKNKQLDPDKPRNLAKVVTVE
jgi:glutamine---fructose-6-phosphate transaminase (isomerizing)